MDGVCRTISGSQLGPTCHLLDNPVYSSNVNVKTVRILEVVDAVVQMKICHVILAVLVRENVGNNNPRSQMNCTIIVSAYSDSQSFAL